MITKHTHERAKLAITKSSFLKIEPIKIHGRFPAHVTSQDPSFVDGLDCTANAEARREGLSCVLLRKVVAYA